MPRPTNISGLKRYLGKCSYFSEYIPNMSSLTIHLRSLFRKDQSFVWTFEHQTEFDGLNQILISPSVMLYHPGWDLPFKVHVDASKHGVGAMVPQNHNGHIRSVRFLSRAFNKTESNWKPHTNNFMLLSMPLNSFVLMLLVQSVMLYQIMQT